MRNNTAKGHLAALVTVLIWGTTFISTKILLVELAPVEILFIRFLVGLLVLIIIRPRPFGLKSVRQELAFAAAGLTGICLYYLLENIALTFSMASNVGIIVSVSPFFTAILSRVFSKNGEGRLSGGFFVGFLAAMAGICLISFGGSELKVNPTGDILAVAAALVWAVYSLLSKKISGYGYDNIQTTKRIFTYGIILMLPALFIFDFKPDPAKLIRTENLLNLIYLGVGASALCFVTWNFAVKVLGAVRTSVYIYMVPVVTVITSFLVLREELTPTALIGVGLTLAGLFISESKFGLRKGKRAGKK